MSVSKPDVLSQLFEQVVLTKVPVERGSLVDNDGINGYFDADADGDGVFESLDLDQDGISDSLEIDSETLMDSLTDLI